MRIGSLFSGAGGLDMAVEEVFGGEVIWQAEIDKAASKVLAYRFPCAPNLGDITAIDWKTVEPPDVLCGGFPCQDVSAAGKRAGIKDGTRSGLWSVFADAIDQLRPPLVVIENVRGLLSAQAHRNVEPDEATVGDRSDGPVLRALGAVLGDLADLGYDAQWTTVAASSVGAPHRRERVFILATDTRYRDQSKWARPPWREAGERESVRGVSGCDGVVASLSGGAAVGFDTGGSSAPQARQDSGDRSGDHRGERADVELLPTPSACNPNDGEGPETWLARRDEVKERLGNGNGMGMPLSIAVQLLPTPVSSDATGGGSHPDSRQGHQDGNGGGRYSSEGHQSTLPGEVRLLPTPQARDFKGTDSEADHKRNSPGMDAVTYHFLPTPAAADGQRGQDFARAGRDASGGDDLVTLTVKASRDNQWGKYAPAIHRWEQIAGRAPSPTEPNKNGNPRLSAAFSEWMMGWPAGWVTDPDIGISRNDQLKIVGNGVCPQQAAAALRYLLTVTEAVA